MTRDKDSRLRRVSCRACRWWRASCWSRSQRDTLGGAATPQTSPPGATQHNTSSLTHSLPHTTHTTLVARLRRVKIAAADWIGRIYISPTILEHTWNFPGVTLILSWLYYWVHKVGFNSSYVRSKQLTAYGYDNIMFTVIRQILLHCIHLHCFEKIWIFFLGWMLFLYVDTIRKSIFDINTCNRKHFIVFAIFLNT